MGTDIHTFVLVKDKKTKEYEDLSVYDKHGNDLKYYASYNNRNYGLFGILAGVRGCDSPIVDNRGIFDSLPQKLYNEYYGYDLSEDNPFYGKQCYHNATWFDFVELKGLVESERAKTTYYMEDEDDEPINVLKPWVDSIENLLAYYGIYSPWPGEVIIQVWFDS